MHELGIAQEIVAIVAERVGEEKVRRVVLEVGRLTLVLPDALRFCFEVCVEGTALEGAELEIRETPGKARCRACGAELLLDQPFGLCACGGTDLEWLSGEELKVKELELA
jgi:hydrogenase nickel incorporation protein HypA/HybF